MIQKNARFYGNHGNTQLKKFVAVWLLHEQTAPKMHDFAKKNEILVLKYVYFVRP